MAAMMIPITFCASLPPCPILKAADDTNGASTTPPSFYDDEENLEKLCDFLRSGEGPPCRQAILMEKRVLYLKGEDSKQTSI